MITPHTSIDGRHWEPGSTYDLSGFDPGKPIDIGLEAITAGANAVMPVHIAYVHVYTLH